MKKTVFALGFFDGVHLGHRALLDAACRLAAANDAQAGAITFQTHPDALVLGAPPVLINTPEDRERLLSCRVKRIVPLPFDRAMLNTPWRSFLEMLRREYDAAGFVCGEDFRFGQHGRGDSGSLADYCTGAGLAWAVVPSQMVNGERVSSTQIRILLEQGELERANALLGHPHTFSGKVTHGLQIGRTLGAPTANVDYPGNLVQLKRGVYATRAVLEDGRRFPAVTNVGVRPTVNGRSTNTETWLLGECGELYDRTLILEFHRFLRPEQKFPSLEAMKQQITRDAQTAQQYFQMTIHDRG